MRQTDDESGECTIQHSRRLPQNNIPQTQAIHHVKEVCIGFSAIPLPFITVFITGCAVVVRTQRPSFSLNLEISGNNRLFAFFDALDHVDEESSGCTNYPVLAFS